MSTMPQTSQNKVLPVNSSGNLAAIINPTQIRELSQKHDKVLQIATLLHTSLNVEEIVAQLPAALSGRLGRPRQQFPEAAFVHDLHRGLRRAPGRGDSASQLGGWLQSGSSGARTLTRVVQVVAFPASSIASHV